MRGYGFPEKDPWIYSPKSEGMQYRTPARRWWKRYLHKSARVKGKEDIQREKATQEQEAVLQNVQATQDGMGEPMEAQRAGSIETV